MGRSFASLFGSKREKVKTTRYYTVSNLQLFICALLIGVISAALITINNAAMEYLQLPVVETAPDGKCVAVSSFRNGEAFTCNDVGTILRNYRTKVKT